MFPLDLYLYPATSVSLPYCVDEGGTLPILFSATGSPVLQNKPGTEEVPNQACGMNDKDSLLSVLTGQLQPGQECA